MRGGGIATTESEAEMAEKITISVDALGGDNAPDVVLEGVAQALAADEDLSIILCGPDEVVSPFSAVHDRCVAQATTEAISMGEHPAQAVRKKKDSSIVVGCRLVEEGAAQGFFSAGSTGACLAAATLVMGRAKGIARPALATVIPSPVRPVVMCDVGANADCKPEYLVQFARMGSVYAQKMLGSENPRCALLNIGEEEEKGSKLAQDAHKLMREKLPNFAGNAEGGDVLAATYDVFVSDGFTGNVALKSLEGTGKFVIKRLKAAMEASLANKIGMALLASSLKSLAAEMSGDEYGGAILLGLRAPVVKGHGATSAQAVRKGTLAAAAAVRAGLCDKIAAACDIAG